MTWSLSTVLRAVARAAACAAPSVAFARAYTAPRLRSGGATPAELERVWPGDALVPSPGLVWTDAVTVRRPAAEVWPWVTQIGQGRGGLYSYDWLENALGCDIHSTDHVVAELQEPMAVGDRVVRMARYAPAAPVAAYEPGHALVLAGIGDDTDRLREGRSSSTWAFVVEPLDEQTCRVVVRSRSRGLVAHLQGPVQYVMQRRLLRGIKERAEGTWRRSAADVVVPLTWAAAAVVTAVHTARAVRTDRPGAVLWSGASGIATQVLVFGGVSARTRATVLAVLAASLADSTTRRRTCDRVRR